MKILHAPTNVANIGSLLSRGQRALGHEAELHVHRTPGFELGFDRITNVHEGTRRERVRKSLKVLDDAIEAGWDVFHFYYHASLLPHNYGFGPQIDLPVLAGLGAKVFLHVVGCEGRLPSISVAESSDRSHCLTCASLQKCLETDKPGRLEPFLEHTRGIITAGPHRDIYMPGIRTNRLPLPIDASELPPGEPQRDVPTVVHMPSNRSIKNSDLIVAAVNEARSRGARFEFELIEGTPHVEAKRRLGQADILIDQLGGSMYATAALEGMTQGRVVVSDVPDRFARPYGEEVPLVRVTAETIADRLIELVADRDERQRLSDAAAAYARRHHDLPAVAARCVEIYEKPDAPLPPGASPAAAAQRIREIDHGLRPSLRERLVTLELAPDVIAAAGPAPSDSSAAVDDAAPSTAGNGTSSTADHAPSAVPPATGFAADGPDAPLHFPVERVRIPADDRPAHERFGESLEEYVDGRIRLGRDFYRRKLREFGLPIGRRVLDIGAGPGQWSAVIAEDHPQSRVTAADRNDFLLECAGRLSRTLELGNMSTASADIYALPFADDAFDTVICIGVLQLVRVDDAMKELVRVLAPGGSLFLNVGGVGFYAQNVRAAKKAGNPKIAEQNWKFIRNTLRRKQNAPFTAFSARRLRALGRAHGLEPVSAGPIQLYPPRQATWHRLPVTLAAVYRNP